MLEEPLEATNSSGFAPTEATLAHNSPLAFSNEGAGHAKTKDTANNDENF
jgi:hypothetical protein